MLTLMQHNIMIVVLLLTRYAVAHQIKPGILKMTLRRVSIFFLLLPAAKLISVSYRSMPFSTVDAFIGNQAFQNERCHICFSLGLDWL